MKKDGKERLFEVMGRLDKTFKPKLNEGFEEMPDTGQAPDFKDMPEPKAMPDEESVEEKSPEEKLAELTAKVDELHAMLHGGEEAEELPVDDSPTEEVPVEPEGDVEIENLQEWNFDKKKGEEHEEKAEDKKEDEKEEDKDELDEEIEAPAKPKVPVQAVAKVGGAK